MRISDAKAVLDSQLGIQWLQDAISDLFNTHVQPKFVMGRTPALKAVIPSTEGGPDLLALTKLRSTGRNFFGDDFGYAIAAGSGDVNVHITQTPGNIASRLRGDDLYLLSVC